MSNRVIEVNVLGHASYALNVIVNGVEYNVWCGICIKFHSQAIA